MDAESIRIETDEDGFWLVVIADVPAWGTSVTHRFHISDPEALYDHVKAAIGPWLYERDMARREHQALHDSFRRGGWRQFECDPEEDYFDGMRHSVRADLLADQT